MICDACGGWVEPAIDRAARTQTCPACGHAAPYETFPLFVVTGTSGAGKTAVLPALRPLLPDWDIFETDVLWDSGGSWEFARANWLRVAHQIAQSRRPVLLCGTLVPDDIDRCDHRHFFDPVHYVALHCDEATRDARLRARPAWRGSTDAFIAEQHAFGRWLEENAERAFDPPLAFIDTSRAGVAETAERLAQWARVRLRERVTAGAGTSRTI